jgi:hypothetical protein
MSQITTKELASISDLLSMEQNLIAKFSDYATQTTDPALKSRFESLVQTHGKHYDQLYANLH